MKGNMTDQALASFGVERSGANPGASTTGAARAGSVARPPVSGQRIVDDWTHGLSVTKQVIPWTLKGIPELASPLAD
jgi:hypothetical protein